MFRNLTALVLWIFLATTSSADLILVTFTKDAAPEFGTPGVLATGQLDVVTNTFTIINFSTTDSAVYAIPNVPIIMNAWEIVDETTIAPWDIDDASQETEIRIALDSGTFGFLADKSNSQINWNTAPGLGRIGWGISYDEPSGTFGNLRRIGTPAMDWLARLQQSKLSDRVGQHLLLTGDRGSRTIFSVARGCRCSINAVLS